MDTRRADHSQINCVRNYWDHCAFNPWCTIINTVCIIRMEDFPSTWLWIYFSLYEASGSRAWYLRGIDQNNPVPIRMETFSSPRIPALDPDQEKNYYLDDLAWSQSSQAFFNLTQPELQLAATQWLRLETLQITSPPVPHQPVNPCSITTASTFPSPPDLPVIQPDTSSFVLSPISVFFGTSASTSPVPTLGFTFLPLGLNCLS